LELDFLVACFGSFALPDAANKGEDPRRYTRAFR
jgi:hypothetical protein